MTLILEPKPKQRQASKQEESHLQKSIVIWYRNDSGLQKNLLWANFSEDLHAPKGNIRKTIEAGQKSAKGLITNLPDLTLGLRGRAEGIELKVEGSSHTIAHLQGQAQFMVDALGIGWFCSSLDGFKDIVYEQKGITAQAVLDFCKRTKKKSVTWKDSLFE